MNEDRVRTIIESEQYQDLYKRYSLYNKEHEKVERYMAGVRDGMELAIKTFRGREYKDSSCDSCKYEGVKSWEKPDVELWKDQLIGEYEWEREHGDQV